MRLLLRVIKSLGEKVGSALGLTCDGGTMSYSQDGEDLILFNMFHGQKSGFYVDIGARDPVRFSNTKLFYDKNWHGINIDPLPGMKAIFDKRRVWDTNLEIGIACRRGKLKYYMFNEPALNGFCADISEERNKSVDYKIISIKEVSTDTLAGVFCKYLKANQEIDFISIDTEGFEMKVLESNDWSKFKPRFILVEILGKLVEDIIEDPVYKYLIDKGYEFRAKTTNTCFFEKRNG